jgi:hypothetical protein
VEEPLALTTFDRNKLNIPGGTTSLNCKSSKINTLWDFIFLKVPELVTDFVTTT